MKNVLLVKLLIELSKSSPENRHFKNLSFFIKIFLIFSHFFHFRAPEISPFNKYHII